MGILTINTKQTTTDAEWLINNANEVLQRMVNKFSRMFGAKAGYRDYVSYMFDLRVEWPVENGNGNDFTRLTYNYFVYDKQEKQIRGLIELYQKVAQYHNIPVTSMETKIML